MRSYVSRHNTNLPRPEKCDNLSRKKGKATAIPEETDKVLSTVGGFGCRCFHRLPIGFLAGYFAAETPTCALD